MSRVVHFEFAADDTQRAKRFFQDVFGWRFEKWEGGPTEYWLIATGADEAPGIDGGMGARREMSAAVVNVLGVENVDVALARIVAAGGSVAAPKQAIPGMGWAAYFTDPEGNLWGVYEDDEQAA